MSAPQPRKSGDPLTDVETQVTLRTLCGCERTFVHGNRASLGHEWRVPLNVQPSAAMMDGPPEDFANPIRVFRLREGGSLSAYWVYEEVPPRTTPWPERLLAEAALDYARSQRWEPGR